ncbi:MAG: hypothetical protein Q7J28_05285 [Caulobacter sp.]|nr:hypothetical protein [Caulobacter sp.]
MTSALFLSFAVIGFGSALLHALFPTHWLPFVLVGRAQGWGLRRVLAVATVAATGHILFTTLVGLLILGAGDLMGRQAQGWLHYGAAAVLFGFGGFYLLRAMQRRTATVTVTAGGFGADAPPPARVTDRAATLGLVGLLALSPGEVLLSFYLTDAAHGWAQLTLLSVVFLAGTLAGMVGLISLAWAGVARLRLDRLVRYDSAILGGVLIALGVIVVVLET